MELPESLIIRRGVILHTELFFATIGHGKFMVIIGEDKENYIGLFFINSNIHRSIANKQELLNLQYPLLKKDYNFLNYDSFLSCTQITKINKEELSKSITKRQTTIKDTLKAEHLQQILTLVRNSKLFTKKEKETFFD